MRFKNETGQIPAMMRLQSGTYRYCRCGETKNVPFCDDSHEGSGIEPLEFEVTTAGTRVICSCGLSEAPPSCDGRHKDF